LQQCPRGDLVLPTQAFPQQCLSGFYPRLHRFV
jgi:hypothetical protein